MKCFQLNWLSNSLELKSCPMVLVLSSTEYDKFVKLKPKPSEIRENCDFQKKKKKKDGHQSEEKWTHLKWSVLLTVPCDLCNSRPAVSLKAPDALRWVSIILGTSLLFLTGCLKAYAILFTWHMSSEGQCGWSPSSAWKGTLLGWFLCLLAAPLDISFEVFPSS